MRGDGANEITAQGDRAPQENCDSTSASRVERSLAVRLLSRGPLTPHRPAFGLAEIGVEHGKTSDQFFDARCFVVRDAGHGRQTCCRDCGSFGRKNPPNPGTTRCRPLAAHTSVGTVSVSGLEHRQVGATCRCKCRSASEVSSAEHGRLAKRLDGRLNRSPVPDGRA